MVAKNQAPTWAGSAPSLRNSKKTAQAVVRTRNANVLISSSLRDSNPRGNSEAHQGLEAGFTRVTGRCCTSPREVKSRKCSVHARQQAAPLVSPAVKDSRTSASWLRDSIFAQPPFWCKWNSNPQRFNGVRRPPQRMSILACLRSCLDWSFSGENWDLPELRMRWCITRVFIVRYGSVEVLIAAV